MRIPEKMISAVLALLLWLPAVSAVPREQLSADHPKHRTARRIFNDLVRAVGDGRTPPMLKIRPLGISGRRQVTWFDAAQRTVTLEERAYDLCAELGPDSLDGLAFLLGHELAHYYKDHGWAGDFGSGLADLEVGEQLGQSRIDPGRQVEIETEADVFGGFYGHVAGYAPLQTVSAILPAIYAAYGRSEKLPGYPSLPERLEIARRSRQSLDGLVPVFAAGRLLLLVERYEEAARCFAHVAAEFPSREILNNAGVAHALEALDSYASSEQPFVYPFELDARTRLQRGPKAGLPDLRLLEEHRRRLLEEARNWFEETRRRDRSYLPASINLAGVADLQGEADEAEFLAGKALKQARQRGDETSGAHALIVRAIARLHLDPDDRETALQDLERARAGAPSLAHLNLEILRSDTISIHATPATSPRPSPPESIAGLDPRQHSTVIDSATAVAAVPGIDRSRPDLDIYLRYTEDWNGLVVETRYATFSFLETQPTYTGRTARNVRIGSTLDQLREAYGPASYLVAGTEGARHAYAAARILFRISADSRVKGWTIYAVD